MRKTLRASAFVGAMCLVTAGLAAQAPSTAPVSSDPGKTVTLSGCIERQSEGAGTASTGAANMPFTLTKAAATASAPAGTSGAVPPSAKTYRLDGAASVISPHVGHKVEITGSVEDQKTATAASAVSAPRLKVDSLKMVSTTCQ